MKLLRVLFFAALAVPAAIGVRLWVVETIYVASASMEPALRVGTRRFADKITLRLREPRRGDIVLFPSPLGTGENVGKRVIALPGETFELRAKKVFIDGKELDEPYAYHRRGRERLINDDLGPLPVPPGSLLVLGDNRDESEDATVWKNASGKPIYFIAVADVTGLVRPWF